jgi:gamma-tubulin complex component 3
VRDLLFAMQGIDSTLFKYDRGAHVYAVQAPVDMHEWDALARHALQCAAMYRRAEAAVAGLEAAPTIGRGQTVRTLAQALRAVLSDHYDVIAALADQQAHLTVARLNVWAEEPYFRLQAVWRMAGVCRGGQVAGGALLSALHRHSLQGDAEAKRMCTEILAKVTEPFFAMLKAWVFEGELRDPYGEFCISDAGAGAGAGADWDGRFQYDETQTPCFMDVTAARKAMLIGKTVHFLRACCADNTAVLTDTARRAAEPCMNFNVGPYSRANTRLACCTWCAAVSADFTYAGRAGLGRALAGMQAVSSRALVDVLQGRFLLDDHLAALRAYLLLAHGAFARRLMHELWYVVSRRAWWAMAPR